jgi:hypothetical protein
MLASHPHIQSGEEKNAHDEVGDKTTDNHDCERPLRSTAADFIAQMFVDRGSTLVFQRRKEARLAAAVTHKATVQPVVWIGDGSTQVQATLQFAGQAPGYPGAYQVNIQIPSSAPVGENLLLWLTNPDGSFPSNKARIVVQ